MLSQLRNKFSIQPDAAFVKASSPHSPEAVAPPDPPAPIAPPSFTPCPTCGGAHFWFDRFGNGPRCSVCHPWPSKSLVGWKEIGGYVVPDATPWPPEIYTHDEFVEMRNEELAGR